MKINYKKITDDLNKKLHNIDGLSEQFYVSYTYCKFSYGTQHIIKFIGCTLYDSGNPAKTETTKAVAADVEEELESMLENLELHYQSLLAARK